VDTGLLPKNDDLIYDIETASKDLCHAIHTRRLCFIHIISQAVTERIKSEELIIKSKTKVPISKFLIV
jgi:hypothetical protein